MFQRRPCQLKYPCGDFRTICTFKPESIHCTLPVDADGAVLDAEGATNLFVTQSSHDERHDLGLLLRQPDCLHDVLPCFGVKHRGKGSRRFVPTRG